MTLEIGIDLDDVVIDHIPHLVNFYNKEYFHNISINQVSTWDIVNHLPGVKGDSDVFYGMWDRFYNTEDFDNLPPVPGALDAIKLLSERDKITFITARKPHLENKTREWLNKYSIGHFPLYFSEKKGELAKELGLDVHIDDGTHNIESVVKHGVNGILYARPWNISSEFTRYKNWDEVLDKVIDYQLEKIRSAV